jgi:hypothetical protein
MRLGIGLEVNVSALAKSVRTIPLAAMHRFRQVSGMLTTKQQWPQGEMIPCLIVRAFAFLAIRIRRLMAANYLFQVRDNLRDCLCPEEAVPSVVES